MTFAAGHRACALLPKPLLEGISNEKTDYHVHLATHGHIDCRWSLPGYVGNSLKFPTRLLKNP